MKLRLWFCAAVLTPASVGWGALDLNLSSDSGPIVVTAGSTQSIPVDVYVTDTDSITDYLSGYSLAITLSSLGTAASFGSSVSAPLDHPPIIADQYLGVGSVPTSELQGFGYETVNGQQDAIPNNGGLLSFDLTVPSLGIGRYTLAFDSADTILDNNSGLLPIDAFNGTAITVVAAPEPSSLLLVAPFATAIAMQRLARGNRRIG